MANLQSINITTPSSAALPEILSISNPDIISSHTHAPVYFLPQALSNAVNFKLNLPEPPLHAQKSSAQSALNSTVRSIFDVTRSPLGDAWGLVNMRRTTGRDVVDARGELEYHNGWVYGGSFEGAYSIVKDGFEVTTNSSSRDPLSDDVEGGSLDPAMEEKKSRWGRDILPTEREFEFTVKVDDLGKQNGVWKIFDGTDEGRVVAEELDNVQEDGKVKERLRFVAEIPMVIGFKEQEIKDFIVACWVCKVWRTRNRKTWLGQSAKKEYKELGSIRNW